MIRLIPIVAFPIVLILGLERFSWKRIAGLSLGILAVFLIVGVPDVLLNSAMLAFISLGLLASLMYAFEGNFVARFGTGGVGPLQLLLGASIVVPSLQHLLLGEWDNGSTLSMFGT